MNKKTIYLIPLLFVFFTLIQPVQAQGRPEDKETVCFCHNINNNPVTICTDNEGLINGHMGHVENGDDTLGICSNAPSVPEFGTIMGAITLLSSTGGYLALKNRFFQPKN
jgi:hypothetical protein